MATDNRAVVEERLFSKVYPELRSMAEALMRGERRNHTWQATELVHEAYLRLVAADHVTWESRAHFFGTAARAMRQILVDHARRRGAGKRGGAWERVSLHPELATAREPEVDILVLDDCLSRLAALDERMARVVELRLFAGLILRDVACVLSVSERTVKEDWSVAKRWLRRELGAA